MFQHLRALKALLLFATVATILCTPAHAQSSDQTIYADSLQNGWQNYGWATLDYASTTAIHGGNDSIAVTVGAYQAIYLHHTAFDSTPYTALSFWIHGGPIGGQRLQVQAQLNGQAQPAVAIGPIIANTWQRISLPLTSLGAAAKNNFDGFWIQDVTGGSQPTFYLDDISLTASNIAIPTSANLAINAAATIRTIDKRIFGINTAVWNSGLGDAGTKTLLNANGTTTMRFPGGSTSDAYDWSTDRSDGSSYQWPGTFPTFAKLAESIGAQTYIIANYGNGTPQMAAAWVAYANGSPSNTATIGVDAKGRNWKTISYWATMRASSPLATDDGYNFLRVNHAAPYGFQYWEIGNECFGGWENDQHGVSGSGLTGVAHDAYTYANYTQQFMIAMHGVDPTIKLGVVGVGGENDWGNGTHAVPNPNESNSLHSGWLPVVLTTLKSLNAVPDFVIHHRYPQGPGSESDSSLLQANTGWASDAYTLRKIVTDYFGNGGASLELDVTESNSVSSGPGKQTTSLVNGLFCADSFAALAQTEFNACLWWDLYNAGETNHNNDPSLYGWRQFGDYGILASGDRSDTPFNTPYPTYYATKLLTHWGHGGDQVVAATSDYNLLSCYAVKQQNGNLALLVINKSPSASLTGHIALANYVPGSSTATVYQYGKSEDAANVDLTQGTITNAASLFDMVFPAYSMSVITLTPTAPAPLAPTNLMATATSTSQINLTWTAVSGATGYTIYRSATSGGSYTQIGSATTPSFSDTGLTASTAYYYVVTASNSTGQSPNSSEATATTQAVVIQSQTLTPIADTDVRDGGNVNVNYGSDTTLYIMNEISGRTGYNGVAYLKFDLTNVTTPPTSAKLNLTLSVAYSLGSASTNLKVYGIADTNWTEKGLTWNTALANDGLNANETSSGTLAASTIITMTPGVYTWDLTSYLADKAGKVVTLQLIENVSDKMMPNFYSRESATGKPTLNLTFSGGTTPALPSAPTSLAASAVSSSQINLTWTAVSGATGYTISRGSTTGGPYTQIGTATTTNYSNTGLTASTAYYYVVTATNSVGQSPNSNEATATTQVAIPSAPANLAASAVSSSQINLTWTAVSNATSYILYRSAATGGPYTQIGTATTPSYNNTGLAASTTYYYVVTASNSAGQSPNSSEATAKTWVSIPNAPANLTASAVSTSQINLTWTAVSGAASYTIYRSATSGGSYAQIGTATTPSYSNTGLTASTTYYYVVTASNVSGNSGNSNEGNATTLVAIPSAPTNLVASAVSASQINLTWSTVSNATSYTIFRGTVTGGPYTQIGTATTPSYSDPGLTASTAYYYVVTASNISGQSPNSNQATATTQSAGVPQSQTLTPIADTDVRDGGNVNVNYGSDTTLYIMNEISGRTGYNGVAYLKFDLTNVTTPPTSAKLNLTLSVAYSLGSASTNLKVYGIADTNWTEKGLTWNTALANDGLNANETSSGTLAASTIVTMTPGVFTWDLTSYLADKAGKIVTLQVIENVSDKMMPNFYSRESATGKPALVLTF